MNILKLFNHLKSEIAKDLFGDQGKDHPNYKRWVKICHPNNFPLGHPNIKMAKECFLLLESKATAFSNPITITHKKTQYKIHPNPVYAGDISDFYVTTNDEHLLKISRNDKHLSFLKQEEKVLKQVLSNYKDKSTLLGFFPQLDDAFDINVKNFPKRRVHVFQNRPDYFSLHNILKTHPHGIDGRHFVWIFKRLLLSLEITHREGYVHGAINPDHFLVNHNHNGKLIGWIHSTENGGVVRAKTKNKKFYPSEILEKKPVDFSTDLYMAGKLGIYLLGGCTSSINVPGTVPGKLFGFLRALVVENKTRRPNSAIELHDDLSDLAQRLYGPSKYVELEVGV